MAPADIKRTEVTIDISGRSEKFLAKGEMLVFDGFLRVYGGGKDDVILPDVQKGQVLPLTALGAVETFSRPPARYSEASLVKKLEELGIGRPSTYAPTITTVQSRGYVERGDLEGQTRPAVHLTLEDSQVKEKTIEETYGADRSKLLPTHLADVTTDFLVKHFPAIVDYDFTAKAEEEFDAIADGKDDWATMIADFYKDFHPMVEKSEGISREESTQTRVLGTDPKSSKPIMARYGRYGPMLQRGETESDDKPDFAPLPEGATLDTVTLEQALEMFKLPRLVGQTADGQDMKANIGRFGPYVQVGKLYVSIKPHDPMKITEEEARALYQEKLEKEANKYIQQFKSGINVVNGPYGPYVTDGKKNARIAKDVDPKTLTEEQCKELLDKAPAKGKGKRFARRKTTKK
jgi:DNA topoisomerase-1